VPLLLPTHSPSLFFLPLLPPSIHLSFSTFDTVSLTRNAALLEQFEIALRRLSALTKSRMTFSPSRRKNEPTLNNSQGSSQTNPTIGNPSNAESETRQRTRSTDSISEDGRDLMPPISLLTLITKLKPSCLELLSMCGVSIRERQMPDLHEVSFVRTAVLIIALDM
jgi:hypothetical protein